MNHRSCALAASALALACFGCGSARDGSAQRGDMLIPACSWPAAANTYDEATRVGCEPRSMFQICEVPSGSVIHPDGTITTPSGGTVTCNDACSPTEYALSCYAPAPTPGATQLPPIPEPDASLRCKAIPIPTPAGALFYCCPCST